jgi:transcription elongation GreA/GreB family factor
MQHYYILPHDREYATRRIQAIDAEIQAMGPDFYEALTQSSETYHDNAPFDALREQQGVLQAEQQMLKEVLARAHPSPPKLHAKKVSIGHKVTVAYETTGTSATYIIVGNWSYRIGQQAQGATIVSCIAPLTSILLGRSVGEVVEFRGQPITITAIAPFHDEKS